MKKLLFVGLCTVGLTTELWAQNPRSGHIPHPDAHLFRPTRPTLSADNPQRSPTLRYRDYQLEFKFSNRGQAPGQPYGTPVPHDGPEHDAFLRDNPCADVSLRSAMTALQTPAVRRTLRAISCLVEPLLYAEYQGGTGGGLFLGYYREFGENFDVAIRGYSELYANMVNQQEVTLEQGARRFCPVMNSQGVERFLHAAADTVFRQPGAYGPNRALGRRPGRPAGSDWSRQQIECYRNASRANLTLFLESDSLLPPPRTVPITPSATHR
jgi:hypothetical protein